MERNEFIEGFQNGLKEVNSCYVSDEYKHIATLAYLKGYKQALHQVLKYNEPKIDAVLAVMREEKKYE